MSPLFVKSHRVPIWSKFFLHHCFPSTRCVHVHLSQVLDLQLHCLLTQVSWERHTRHIVVSTHDRNWPSLQDRLPSLLVQLQAPADNHLESILVSSHVSSSEHIFQQPMSLEYRPKWRDCCVSQYSLIDVFIDSHVPNNPRTTLFTVIRYTYRQSCAERSSHGNLHCDSIHLSVQSYFVNSTVRLL